MKKARKGGGKKRRKHTKMEEERREIRGRGKGRMNERRKEDRRYGIKKKGVHGDTEEKEGRPGIMKGWKERRQRRTGNGRSEAGGT